MANEKRLIDADELMIDVYRSDEQQKNDVWHTSDIEYLVMAQPTVDAVEVVHGQRLYNAHEVAEIIADLFGDACACNFKSIDEWLPYKCELQSACPNPVGVACWEQYLKYREAKMDGDGNG